MVPSEFRPFPGRCILSIPAEKLTIEKMIYGGEGLGRVDGEVVLTPFVLPGESIEVGRLESRQHVQRAQVVRIEAPSPDRIELHGRPPVCLSFAFHSARALRRSIAKRSLMEFIER